MSIYIFGFLILVMLPAHTCFSGSVNSWAHSMEYGFQVDKFLLEVQKASSLVCLVQNGPVLIWVACIGHRGSSKLSLRSVRAFSEAFLEAFCNVPLQCQGLVAMRFIY